MDEIAEIKTKIDIVDLINAYVTLKKAGANYKGLCPFHHERSPSFMVNPERQIFKCFGCQKGGDIFSFVQESETIEFGDALKMLADRAGVTLTPKIRPKPGEAPSEKSRYYRINHLAAQLFHKLLLEHSVAAEAREYLARRGLTTETLKKWQVGYAPRRKVLTPWLAQRGFGPKEIEQAGKPDMFYDRIMFPINDIIGNTIGFTGRILGPGEPKYLNTPETTIFRKSRILFGLEWAKTAIKNEGAVILAEGQMDVIAASQAGTANIVASSGTALTQDHLRILARYGVDIILAFDSDSAGLIATKRAIELALADDLSVKVLPIPQPYKDIGELVQADPAGWLALVKAPVPAVEWHMTIAFAPYRINGLERKLAVDEKKKIAKELIPVLRRLSDRIEQAHYIQLLAKRLGVKERVIQEAIGAGRRAGSPQPSPGPGAGHPTLNTEEALLGLLERSPELQKAHVNLYTELKEWYNRPITDLLFAVEEQYRGLSASELRAEVDLLIKRYQENQRDRLKSNFADRINQAETAGNRPMVKQLLTEFHNLINSDS